MKLTAIFPVLTAALIVLFYCLLPPLQSCALSPRLHKKSGREERTGEILALCFITLLYALAAFSHLGDRQAPKTSHVFTSGESVTLELDGPHSLSRAMAYSVIGTGGYTLALSEDGVSFTDALELEQNYVALLKWHDLELSGRARYVRLTAWGEPELGSLTVYDETGAPIAWRTTGPLTDEQSLTPGKPTFLNSCYFDEIYHARTALEHMRGIYPYEISHPPLGKLLIALGMVIFGVNPFGWRFMGTLFGVLMLPLLYLFARRLFGRGLVPICCTLLLGADFMHFVQTRIATIDTYGVFFTLLMYAFMYRWLFPEGSDPLAPSSGEGRKRNLALSGLFFGLGAACKWTCLYAGAGLGLIWALHWALRLRREGRRAFGALGKNILFCLVFFVALPAAIYYVSYYPYGVGKGLTPGTGLLFRGEYLQCVLDNQSYMFRYHSGVNASHPYSSRWYQWMLDIRPILYYLDYEGSTRASFGAFTNPVLCWAGLLGLFVLGWCALARRDRRALFLLLGYLAQLLPWVFISRITFAYHYFPCALFLTLVLGYVFCLLRDNVRAGRRAVLGLTALSVLVFIFFYPALWGQYLDTSKASLLYRWLKTWPF